MNLKTGIGAIAAASLFATAANAGSASLIGDAVDVELTGAIPLADFGVVVGPGVELQGGDFSTSFGAFLFPSESIDIGADRIDILLDLALGEGAVLTFSDLDFGAGIGDVALTSNIAAVQDPQLSFTSNSVTLNLADWFFSGEVNAVISLELTEVPAPGALALFGLAGVAARRRRA